LPLHASLGASPGAAAAPYLPPPLTYWLILTLAIATAVLVVRHALEPLCGQVVTWLALVLLFWSVPIVNYTIYDDWLETAVTYCAFIACVFAPHAWLASRAGIAVAAAVCALIAASHPGYWPLLACTLAASAALALCRTEYAMRARLTAIAGLAVASLVAVVPHVPDITREIAAAGDGVTAMRRFVEGPRSPLIVANLFPWGLIGPRMPFTFLCLAAVSIVVALASPRSHARVVGLGAGLLSIVLGIGAARLEPGGAQYAPSVTWALRDPALVFAVFSAACAASIVMASGGGVRHIGRRVAIVLLAVASLQGPAYARWLTLNNMPTWHSHRAWTHDMTAPSGRAAARGFAFDAAPAGARLAFWPGVRGRMRDMRRPSTDFVDAGYFLVTAWTKQRTMRPLVQPNELLFNQSIELSPEVLCDPDAVRFLQLRYLLLPADAECAPWTRLPGVTVDETFAVAAAAQSDRAVWGVPISRLSPQLRSEPALSAEGALLPALSPWPRTSVAIDAGRLVVHLDDARSAVDHAIVLPVAYDPAWQPSDGRTENVGGLLTLVDVQRPDIRLDFIPDRPAVVRALAMTLAQVMGAAALLALAWLSR
jgi:hypothetical protein